MTVTEALAKRVAALSNSANIPDAVMEKTRLCLLNGYGIGLACFETPYAPVASRAALAIDGEQPHGATLLYDGRKVGLMAACVANGALLHGRAQEDAAGAAHLGAVLIPMLTAAVEMKRMPIERLLPALLAGYEVGGLLEFNYAPFTTPVGVRASPVYGVVAAAAAAALGLGLDETQTAAALANAASFAGGILQSFEDGTDEWRYQVGLVAGNGWMAAELARAGSVSAPRAFEGGNGFVKALARTDCDASALMAQVGTRWFIDRVVFKPYPVCAFNQTPVTAALQIRDQLQGKAIRQVEVRMNPYETGYAGMDSVGPFHSVSGTLMSIPFCIANTLLYGAPTMKKMMVYDDGRVLDLIERIRLVPDKSVARLCCKIDIEFTDATPPLHHHQVMDVADYNYDRQALLSLLERVCGEVGVGGSALQTLEGFVDAPAQHGIDAVLRVFADLRNHR